MRHLLLLNDGFLDSTRLCTLKKKKAERPFMHLGTGDAVRTAMWRQRPSTEHTAIIRAVVYGALVCV